ncbi:hypothetical protein A1O1_06418 [Capronia coronata CBS 617.96]|uniref:Uncharacterized protein n=1 Tax=Capronia coronata CBS 617.96 TaxID=1182541 RepID=W9YUT9_9EURO|nr:uncharacterized protein A1O1_06418 [Capronia coronata CBS 617.96]EXJ86049.1 hypothetical protein A1O1_06418 [Capronia coronata CBS 617.96]
MPNVNAYPIPHDLFIQELPPSPTLTNPDMILPYQPIDASSPTPFASSPTLQTSLPVRPDSAVSLGSSQPDHDASIEVGIATTVRMPPRAAPLIGAGYDGYEHGAPLSDIGEEETPRSRKSRRADNLVRSNAGSPTPAGRPSHMMRRMSTQSSSSNSSDLGDWEDFDTSNIMNERLAADVANVSDDEMDEPDSRRNSTVAASPEDEMTLLNEQAERILANARKRLTHMEDHLTKARHSILMLARSSPNASEQHQPAGGLYRSISAAGASHRKPRHLYPVVRSSSAAHTRGGSDVSSAGLKRLSVVPDVRSASALEYGRRQESPQAQNSPASNHSFNSPLRVLQEEQDTPSTSKTSPESSVPRGLGINTFAALSKEDISATISSPATAIPSSPSAMSSRSKELREQMSDLRARISDLKEKAHADSLRRQSMQSIRNSSPFTDAHTPEQWYTSAPEYKETGSPLNTNAGKGWSPLSTNGGQDWSPSRSKRPVEIQITPVTPQAQTFRNVKQPTTDDSRLLSEARTDKNTPSLHRAVDLKPAGQDDSISIIQESLYEDAAQEFDDEEPVAASEEEQIYLNEVLEESLQEAEPDLPELVELSADGAAERHEDRVDAFDYENMFLHSALGNYTGTGTRSESPSESDSSSTATTRVDQNTPTTDDGKGETDTVTDAGTEEEDEEEVGGEEEREEATTPVQETFPTSIVEPDPTTYLAAPVKPWTKAVRSNSMDSVSTAATFATAAEGDGGAEEEEDNDVPSEILQWGNGGGAGATTGFPLPPVSPKREVSVPPPPMSPSPSWGGRVQQGPSRTPHIVQTPTSVVVSNGMPTPPMQSPGTRFAASSGISQLKPVQPDDGVVDHPANTEILMESLVKLADPDFKIAEGRESVTFSDVDKGLVLDLLRAVGGVCNEILKAEMAHEIRAVKVLRRRLDDSRKLLEGHTIQ